MVMEKNLKEARVLLDIPCQLGEGMMWSKRERCLYWVDILHKRIHSYHLESKESACWDLPSYVSKIVPWPDGSGKFLVAMQRGLAVWTKETQDLTIVAELDSRDGQIRTNDGGIDPEGNFWFGTMHMQALSGQGKLMRFRNGTLETVIPEVTIPNGIVWPNNSPYFYFIDTYTREIRRYARPSTLDTIRKVGNTFSTLLRVPEELGMPDGMCIGPDGHLWIAHWGGFAVCKWHIETGELLNKIEVDAPHVTSCCFGGPTGSDVFISTAREGLTNEQLESFPDSGKVFHFNLSEGK